MNLVFKDKVKKFSECLTGLDVSNSGDKFKCFISVGYKTQRARVFCCIANSKDAALKQAADKAAKYISGIGEDPPWVKVDFVVTETELPAESVLELASAIKKYYFKYGVAFDSMYNIAFLQQEINANALFNYEICPDKIKKSEVIKNLAGLSLDTDSSKVKSEFNKNNIEHYLKMNKGQALSFNEENYKKLIIFETRSYFFDIDNFHEMDTTELNNSRRRIENPDKNLILNLIKESAAYLCRTVLANGKFVYGYFSCFNREIKSYNIVRHALGVYSLAEVYLLTKDQYVLGYIKRTLKYMLRNHIYELDDMAFVVDYDNNNEIKLGGLGICVLAISKCLEINANIMDKPSCAKIMRKIGRGIVYMQDSATGQFTHVLEYPNLNLKDSFRTVYYSGEAAFALAKIYSLFGDEYWLNSIKKAFNFFIQNDYWKYYDHWLAYSTNELIKIDPSDAYFEFGLKNAFNNLDFVINRITTWATFMEMLMAANSMTDKIKELKKDYLLESYDIQKLKTAVSERLKNQLNGIFFPELAMYFKSPETILYGVFIRHHSFRVRNDDVAHHLSGYCHYVSDYFGG